MTLIWSRCGGIYSAKNMRYALTTETPQHKIEASKDTTGICPGCGKNVESYCGELNVWHWRHLKDEGCGSRHEPMTEWHKSWQDSFGVECSEVWRTDGSEKHPADIITPHGLVIEFQNSEISPEKIREREAFWSRLTYSLIWVFNAEDFKNHFTFSLRPNEIAFNWDHPRKSHWEAANFCFYDFGNHLFKMHSKPNKRGLGHFIPHDIFIRVMKAWRPKLVQNIRSNWIKGGPRYVTSSSPF